MFDIFYSMHCTVEISIWIAEFPFAQTNILRKLSILRLESVLKEEKSKEGSCVEKMP